MTEVAKKYNVNGCMKRGEVRVDTKKENESNYSINCNLILFINRGQNYVLIDDQILLPPGGYHLETNVCHDYNWRFIVNTDPPTVNKPLVYAGNHLSIRIGNAPPGVEMDMYTNSQGGATGSSGGGAPTDIAVTATNDTVDTDFTIPAGAVYLEIRNVGGISPATIQVNGGDLPPGGIIKRQIFSDGVNRYTQPEFDVVTNGSLVEYYYETNPSLI